MPAASRTSTPSARARVAFAPGGQHPAGLARCARPRGRHEGGCRGRPQPCCDPHRPADRRGLEPFRVCRGRAAPAGCEAQRREHPGPQGAGGRRLGVPRAGPGQPTAAPATGTPPTVIQASRWKAQVRRCTRDRRRVATGQQAPGVPVAMARAWVGVRWAIATEGPVTPSGHKTPGPFTPHSAGVPTCMGRGAAPVGCHPRRRDEPPRAYASLACGRHPTAASQVVANPRIAAGAPVGSSWLRRF